MKTHLHMPAGKVEELYATLKKRNADIYIQRSKLMYQGAPQRTRLFAWSMTNVELMVSFMIFKALLNSVLLFCVVYGKSFRNSVDCEYLQTAFYFAILIYMVSQ